MGAGQGRIWRVKPDGWNSRGRPTLGTATTSELVQLLGHRNGWHRDTAARLLYERQDAAAVVQAGLADPHPRVREHAVRLAEQHAQDASVLDQLVLLADYDDPRVRYQLAFSLGEFPSGQQRDAALARLAGRDGSSAYPRAAVLSSLVAGAGHPPARDRHLRRLGR